MSTWQRQAWRKLAKSHVILAVCGLLALLLILEFGGSDESDSQEAPFATDTVLMIVLEGVSPDDLTRYALQSNKMPALAKFAKESTWFDRHWAQSNGTNAAFASLLSGVYSGKHGLGSVRRFGYEGLSSEVTLISEDLSAAGFDCAASVGTRLFSGEFSGFDQGWSAYAAPELSAAVHPRNAETVLDAIGPEFTKSLSGSARTFGLFEFNDARNPELAPSRLTAAALVEHLQSFEEELPEIRDYLADFRSGKTGRVNSLRSLLVRRRGHPVREALEAAYHQAQFQFLDEQLGRLFAMLGKHDRYRDALIIVTGNQGAERSGLEESERGVGRIYPDRMRVPLLIRLPGGQRTRAVQGLTQSIDLRPTVLAALGLDCADSDGLSLLPLVVAEDEVQAVRERVFLEDSLLGEVAAVDDFWLVRGDAKRSYLPLDEGRGEQLSGEIPPVPKAMLERTRRALDEFIGGPRVRVELSPRSEQRYTVRLDPLSSGWLNGNLIGEQARDVQPRHRIRFEDSIPWGQRVSTGVAVELSASNETPSGFELWPAVDPADFYLTVSVAEGELEEGRLQLGDLDLTHLALPRLAMQNSGEWPEGDDGHSIDPIVDVTRESGRWLNIKVGGEPGRQAKLLMIGEMNEIHGPSELTIRAADELRVEHVEGRTDSFWVTGVTPLSISAEVHPAREFGISVALEGQQVAVRDIRFLGRRFAAPGSIRLVLPSWLPGVREHVESPRDSSQDALEPGTLWIGCTSRREFANDRPVPNQSILDRLQTLGSQD